MGTGQGRDTGSGVGRVRSAPARFVAAVAAFLVMCAAALVAVAPAASANTTNPANIPYTCTTNGFGNQDATYGATITDSKDPAAVGDSVTYRFVVPFAQDPPPVTATYKGGTTTYPIPAGLNVTSVSTPPKAGSNLTATASVQGGNIVVTSTGSQPIDGGTYPTPDLVVVGTVTSAAAGPGVVWRTPSQIVANVDAQFVGSVVATCTPNDPTVVITTTTVPAGPQAPVGVNQSVSTPTAAPKAITLAATDTDTPAAQLTYAITTPPAHGTLTGTAPNVTYTSASGYVGNDSFVFKATDPGGLTGTGTVSIKVFNANVIDNTPPVITITSPQNGAVLTPGQVVNAAFSCTDATTAVDSCTGTVANGAPVAAAAGVYAFVVNAKDAAGNLAKATVSYRVVNPAQVAQSYNAANAVPATCSPALLSGNTLPLTVAAPTQVGTGKTLTMRLIPGAGSVPALRTRTNIVYTMAVPANGTAVSASVVPGTGTANASASASAAVTGGKATLKVAGPIAGGTTAATAYTPPAIDVVIQAGTTANAQVQTKLEAYTETDVVSGVGQVPVTRNCTAGDSSNPSPVLTKTTIIDTTPPTVSITSPANGGLVALGASLKAQFTCADGVALSACAGTTASGSSINTSTAGVKTLVVLATDAAGNIAQQLVSFRVVPVSFTSRFEESDLPLLDEVAAYYQTDRVGVMQIGVFVLAYYLTAHPELDAIADPPANDGPVAITASYTPADAQKISNAATQFGVTGDQLQTLGVGILLYFYTVHH